jgi:hypothetical protein
MTPTDLLILKVAKQKQKEIMLCLLSEKNPLKKVFTQKFLQASLKSLINRYMDNKVAFFNVENPLSKEDYSKRISQIALDNIEVLNCLYALLGVSREQKQDVIVTNLMIHIAFFNKALFDLHL